MPIADQTPKPAMKRFPSWRCQNCGDAIGWMGRGFQAVGLSPHACSKDYVITVRLEWADGDCVRASMDARSTTKIGAIAFALRRAQEDTETGWSRAVVEITTL